MFSMSVEGKQLFDSSNQRLEKSSGYIRFRTQFWKQSQKFEELPFYSITELMLICSFTEARQVIKIEEIISLKF